jgi:hypothetical protein
MLPPRPMCNFTVLTFPCHHVHSSLWSVCKQHYASHVHPDDRHNVHRPVVHVISAWSRLQLLIRNVRPCARASMSARARHLASTRSLFGAWWRSPSSNVKTGGHRRQDAARQRCRCIGTRQTGRRALLGSHQYVQGLDGSHTCSHLSLNKENSALGVNVLFYDAVICLEEGKNAVLG